MKKAKTIMSVLAVITSGAAFLLAVFMIVFQHQIASALGFGVIQVFTIPVPLLLNLIRFIALSIMVFLICRSKSQAIWPEIVLISANCALWPVVSILINMLNNTLLGKLGGTDYLSSYSIVNSICAIPTDILGGLVNSICLVLCGMTIACKLIHKNKASG